ncbi:transketolase [Acholeplasma morum]|uniref:transketolase n=1 Tax=Paracholeplasma morum TaxID=264637 RepID=UPI00195D8C97|nr:transketolase [Paracholeplasma morum]MBM7452960.1 transketolase [Paracholeplasma morum]
MEHLDQLSINSLRFLGVDAINKANSGHPGIVLGAAPMAHVLYTRFLKAFPKKSNWFNRDRFILSAGHGSMLLYGLNHLSGYQLSIEDLKHFRQIGKTPGHPEYGHTDGVETTSGPLGQGISNGVGMAIAETHLAAKFNKEGYEVVDHFTYVLCGDGDLQEGVALEALSLAGHLGLGKLIVLFDSNDIQLDGKTDLAFSDDHKKKFESMNWHYQKVSDGNDLMAINKAIKKAQKETDKPSVIEVKTIIGYGTSLAGTSNVHGSPIGEEKANELRKNLNWSYAPFEVPQEVYGFYKTKVYNRGSRAYKKWINMISDYQEAYPQEAQQLKAFIQEQDSLELKDLPTFEVGSMVATRSASGKVLDGLSKKYPNIIGGSADLTASTKAKGADGHYSKTNRLGRNINFGVREHAMGAITNGIVLHGGLKAFSGAFFVFSDYMKPSIRLAALMQIPSIFVFSHDTIAVGEDGPTHEPIEQLAGLRVIPGLNVIRPADANETKAAWLWAVKQHKTPTAIILTRQNVPTLPCVPFETFEKGAFVVSKEHERLDGILLAAGSEVSLAIEAQKVLKDLGKDVRVVSMPSHYLFEKQDKAYQESILPSNVKTLAIEMGSSQSWYKYTKHVFGIDRYGLSAPLEVVIKAFGFTKEKVAETFVKL